MKRRLLVMAAVAALLIAAAGCTAPKNGVIADPPAADSPAADSPVVNAPAVIADGISLQTVVGSRVFGPNRNLSVEVRVKNDSTEPVKFVRSNGCDPGVRVALTDGTQEYGRFTDGGPDRVCTQALAMGTLAPGAEIRLKLTWVNHAGQPALSPGTYTVGVSFNRGESFDATRPVTQEVKVSYEGSTTR